MNSLTRKTRQPLYNIGFSLLEVLVVTAILTILAAVSIQSFSSYAKLQQFQRFADEVENSLQLARQKTLASKNDVTYGVYFGARTVEIFSGATPTPGNSANTIFDFYGQDYSATSSLTSGVSYVVFERVTGEASATGVITVDSAILGRTATYTIYQSGLVE